VIEGSRKAISIICGRTALKGKKVGKNKKRKTIKLVCSYAEAGVGLKEDNMRITRKA